MTTENSSDKHGLESVIDNVLSEMVSVDAGSAEFEKMTDQLVKLHKMKTDDRPPRVSPDVLATVAANLAGILIIVGHERFHIVTSKALGFVLRVR